MQAQPSLGTPLQLESSPRTHESRGAGGTAPVHSPNASFTHVLVPNAQMPMSVVDPHGCVSPSTQVQPSFGMPLQFVSSPRTQESSAPGPTASWHAPQSLAPLPESAVTMQMRVPDL